MSDARSVIEELVSTINAHDLPAGRALYAADVRAVTATGRHLDLDGLDAVLAATFSAFPDLRIEVQRWVVDGDVVATEEVMEGTHLGPFAGLAPTGRKVRLTMVHINRVSGGRIVERVAYHDSAGILRQLEDSVEVIEQSGG